MSRSTVPILMVLALASCKKETPAASDSTTQPAAQLKVTVDGAGYHPEEAKAPAGKVVRLVFTRTSDDGCGQELVFPTLNVRRDLPLNVPIGVTVTMPESGKLAFTCGMDMYRGAIVAE